jgi:subfamily B ATP-binding cassette protein MsbA
MPCKMMIQSNVEIQHAIAASDRVLNILDSLNARSSLSAEIKLAKFDKAIKLKKVTFKFDASDKYIIHDMNLDIYKGDIVSIIGLSGSGKSTLVDLLSRTYEKISGELMIDEDSINKFSEESYFSLIGVCYQDAFVIDGTILENLFIDNVNVIDQSPDCIRQYIVDFINEFEDGINSYICENGKNISGGQKHRLAICRLILRNTQILIFDEPTSSFDEITRNGFYNLLENLKGINKTIIVVSHSNEILPYSTNIIKLNENGYKQYLSFDEYKDDNNTLNVS